MDTSTLYCIWLASVCGHGSELPLHLITLMGDVRAVYEAGKEELEALHFLTEEKIRALCDKDLTYARKIVDRCARQNIGILPFSSALYPHRLRQIQNPPAVLYYRGQIPDLDNRLSVAIVGTRSMTDDGRKNTYRIAYELSLVGAIVVSGMALGIDGMAQQAALDAGGGTIAVLGTAIDRCYPKENLPLYNRLILSGGILSEYAPGEETHRWNFPERNRIISGLCQATLVAEAGVKSGALITAQHALSQGRDLYAMPGDAGDPAREGTNALIKNGALPVTTSDDILSKYAFLYQDTLLTARLQNPVYFTQYDDRMKCDDPAFAEMPPSHIANRISHPFRPETPKPAEPRTAPRQRPVREERYTETAAAILAEEEAPAAEALPRKAEEKESKAEKTEVSAEKVSSPAPQKALPADMPEEQKQILSLLTHKKTADELCASGIAVDTLLSSLTILELGGYIRALPGGYYEAIT